MGLTVVALNDARRWGWLHGVWIAAEVTTDSKVEVGEVEDSERVLPLVVGEGRGRSGRKVNAISDRRQEERRRALRSSKITRSDGVIRGGRRRDLARKTKISQSDSAITTITARRRGWARKIVSWLLERLRSCVAVVNCLCQ